MPDRDNVLSTPGVSIRHPVRKALEPGLSSRAGGRGYGLSQLRETVDEDDGRLVIRSGAGQLVVEIGSEAPKDDCVALPGTPVEVAFPTYA